MKKKTKASKIWGLTAVILIVGSLTLLLYPTVSKVINQQKANKTITEFNEAVEKIDSIFYPAESQENDTEESNSNSEDLAENKITDYIISNSDYSMTLQDVQRLYRDSRQYNLWLKSKQSFDGVDFSSAALNLYDYGIYNGVYGYISIPDINLQMPILLGSSNQNMAAGVTHLYSTSLPTGEKDTNCVISGHTGFTGKTFFDDIPTLSTGSIITVTTFFGSLDYEVTEIKKIDITQTDDLYIDKGSEKLTLLTCADGGSKRWQVSCDRIISKE